MRIFMSDEPYWEWPENENWAYRPLDALLLVLLALACLPVLFVVMLAGLGLREYEAHVEGE